MDNKRIGLIGAGGQADEVASYFDGEIAFRAVEAEYVEQKTVDINDILSDESKNVKLVIAVGPPALRKRLFEIVRNKNFATVISKNASISDKTSIGEGTILADDCTLTTNVTIGSHVLINIGSNISHDVSIGNFCNISPGVNIAGNVTVGDGVFIGIGATISNGVSIADGSVIGAGSVILDDINEPNSVCVGIPGKVIKYNDGWLNEI